MKIESKEFKAGGIKTVHTVNFGTTKKAVFEVWEYETGYFSFPTMNEQGGLKFTPKALEAVLNAIKLAVTA